MFEIGFTELLLVAIVALLVLGPERLPHALRTLGLWIGRMRRSFNTVRDEIEREIGMEDIRRQLHNEAVLDELKRIERNVKSTVDAATTGKQTGTLPRPAAKADIPSAGDAVPAPPVASSPSTGPATPAAATGARTAAATMPTGVIGGEQPRAGT